MRLLPFLYLIAGLAILAAVLYGVDLAAVGEWLGRLGFAGMISVIIVYGVIFTCDAAAWWLILAGPTPKSFWLARLWLVRLVGEAFNAVIPAASMGGEPVKALLLKKRYDVDYATSAASLVMAKTTTLLALIVFSAMGLTVLLNSRSFASSYGTAAASGLAALAVGVVGFFAVQHWGLASRLAGRLSANRQGGRLARLAGHLEFIDGRFADLYRKRPGRFAAALALAMASWLLGAVELLIILYFLGYPLTLSEALMVEAALQLVRAGSFFIPANLGASEIGFVLLIGALTGQPPLGLAAALVRRARELLWIAGGLAVGWRLSFTPAVAAAARADSELGTGDPPDHRG